MKAKCLPRVFRFSFTFFLLICIFDFYFLTFDFAFADSSSASYKLQFDANSGGSELLLTSTNYKLEDGTLDFHHRADLSSTNYAAHGRFGISVAPVVEIQSVTPGSFSRFFTDESTSYVVTADDPDSDTLQYQAKQDAATKDGPQASSTLTWALSGSDSGRHTVSNEVIDPDGTVRVEQAMYAFRRPTK
ncbi:MAG: hypothetical protein HYZ85_04650 [Candidatus Omnitrophica bacterium]|nr:hypothetical protein [Candidatus Omnitrophota bacterium]